jgi:hypothetical protein
MSVYQVSKRANFKGLEARNTNLSDGTVTSHDTLQSWLAHVMAISSGEEVARAFNDCTPGWAILNAEYEAAKEYSRRKR